MNQYLAKSSGQTIAEHTQDLLDNFKLLQKMYPSVHVNWDLLYLACCYHDLGKMNRAFQKKLIPGGQRDHNEVPHGLLSTAFIPMKELKNTYNLSELKALAYAVAYHHNRNFSAVSSENMVEQIEIMKSEAEGFSCEFIDNIQVRQLSKRYFELNKRIYAENNQEEADNYLMIKGLLNRIDYAASGGIAVEVPNDFLLDDMDKLLKRWQLGSDAKWNALQQFMLAHQNENVVVIAQTGEGKTEAGLLWLGNQKGFFTLPLRTAINAIYKRLKDDVFIGDFESKLGLLHSETYGQYLAMERDPNEIEEYYTKTKQMTLPLTICTIDQLFDFVFRYDGFEAKLATLSYSKVIVDEIQMYSADLLAYLITGLRYMQQYGGKFAIMTATLPGIILHLLKQEGIEFIEPPTPFINEKIRHRMKLVEEVLNTNLIIEHYQENKILVICNTVKKAKEIYTELNSKFPEDVHLLHSQFIKRDRAEKETAIFEMGQKESKQAGIWVTTQVVEASLDIDFDFLFTELSDLNGLFQRFGRCYRKREITTEVPFNCYVYDGGESKSSGVGTIIDEEIFGFSKEALRVKGDGDFSEADKISLIEVVYAPEKLAKTNYYQAIVANINYLKLVPEGEFDRSEVLTKFRNINSLDVIPEPIYEENSAKIDKLIGIIQMKHEKGMSESERINLRQQKSRARTKLAEFKVALPGYMVDKFDTQQVRLLKINAYEELALFACKYKFEDGITLIKPEKEELFF